MGTLDIDAMLDDVRSQLRSRGQEHVLRFWDELADDARENLLADIASVPWETIDSLIPTHVLSAPPQATPSDLDPPVVHKRAPQPGQEALYEEAIAQGRDLIKSGRVAAFTVAGGQGTRLGFDGPKGAVAVTPVGDRSLFALFASAIKAVRQRDHIDIPWYIMTSPANHGQTFDYLKENSFFGLPQDDVILFSQGMLPALDREGKLLLAAKDRLALAPDGHGGSLKALVHSGALDHMTRRGIEIISYFQVDNPLVKPFDPLFVGLHEATGSEMSTKVVRKADDLERVGNVCRHDGKTILIEYSDLPDAVAHAKNPDGTRMFDAGNIAIHLLNVSFVDRIIAQSFDMPFRRAEKKVPYVNDQGDLVDPDQPNGIKLETFVFDALPLAANPLVFEVDRAEEFSPVKNASGVDSLESSQRHQIERACSWLASAGVAIPRKADGTPDLTIVIDPSFALDAADVASQVDRIPELKAGDCVYLQ